MSEPRIDIRLEGEEAHFAPGAALRGEYRLVGIHECQVKSLEVSVLWCTEGKGDEDMAVHEFWRQSAEDGDVIDTLRPGRFSTQLPNSPLSYQGRIITLRWCVRVRVFLHRNREVVGEKTFCLGAVPPIAPPAAPVAEPAHAAE